MIAPTKPKIDPDIRAEGGESRNDAMRKTLGLAAGFVGISLVLNLSRFLLVFFYLPPDRAGLPQLVTDRTYFVVFNVVVVIIAAGRLVDAVTDPLIALWSDRSRRRVPMMTAAVLPGALCTALLFLPPSSSPGTANVVWLIVVQAVMFVATTAYLTPLFALLKDLTAPGEDRTAMSARTGAAWALGLIGAAMAPTVSRLFETFGANTLTSWRLSIALGAAIGAILMLVPRALITESPPATSQTALSIRRSIELVRTSPFAPRYLVADAAYWCGLAVIQTGLLFYLTILLGLDRGTAGPLILLMIVLSMPLMLGPLQRWKASMGIKRLYLTAFAISIVCFGLMSLFGQLPGPALLQAVIVMAALAVPTGIIGGLSNGLLGDIAEASQQSHGTDTTAMFFAARSFIQKLAQTLGLGLFATFASFGRDIGDDVGIRVAGLVAVAMYLIAAAVFRRFDEDALKSELPAPNKCQ